MHVVKANALLLKGIYYGKTKLLGRWCSNQMMTFLNTSALLLHQIFASIMVYHGDYAQVSNP